MCCMALLHSRVREVFYIFPAKKGGGFGCTHEGNGEGDERKGLGVHGRKDLNHRFEVWRWTGEIDEGLKEKLRIGGDIAV